MRGGLLVVLSCALGCGSHARQEPPPPDAKPPPTVATISDVWGGKPDRGQAVAMDLVMTPELLFRTRFDETDRVYVSGVPAGSPYLKRLAELAAVAKAWLPRARAAAGKVTDAEWEAVSGALADLSQQLDDAVSTAEQIAVFEVREDVPIQAEMQTVSLGFDPAHPMKIDVPQPTDVEGVNAALAVLEKQRPPDPASPMPDLGILPQFDALSPSADVRAYNRMVARYNKELRRRRPAMARRVALELEKQVAMLESMAARTPERIEGTVIDFPPAIWQALTQQGRLGDGVAVRERPDGTSWTWRYFQGIDLRVITDPPGASVSIDGNPLGKTPMGGTGYAPGDDLHIKLERAGVAPIERTVTITAVPSRLVLVAEQL